MVLKYILICLSSTLIPAYARPEAALPYYYPLPSVDQNILAKTRNVASTSSQTFGQTASLNQAYVPTNYNTQQNYAIPSSSYGTPILRTTVNTGQLQSNTVLPSSNYGSPDLLYSNQSPTSAYTNQPEPPVSIQKHIYVHVAPPDVEEQTVQRIQQQGVRQKHYKIIFVKVPSYPTPEQYIAQQQALQQEKTLIYVLVKKPEDALTVRANQIASAPINRPEVYFIKYKAKSEHGGQIGGQNLVQQTEGIHGNGDNQAVVIDSAARGVSSQSQGYNYDRPEGVLD